MDAFPPLFPSISSTTPPPLYSPSMSINDGLTCRSTPPDMRYGQEEDPVSIEEDYSQPTLDTAKVERVLPSRKSVRQDEPCCWEPSLD